MGTYRKLLSFLMWCSIILHKNVNSQGYYYKLGSNMNSYQLINGKFQYIPSTTPQPGLLETLFPWAGNAYDSTKSPEEDAAIMNSLADNELAAASAASASGILSWLPIPSMPTFSLPSFLPGSSGEGPIQAEQSMQYATGMLPNPPGPNPNLPPNHNSNDNMNFQDMSLVGAPSQAQPVVVPGPGPGPEIGQAPPQAIPPGPQQQQQPPSQYAVPSPNQIPQEIRNNLNPTFQFHQQMKDALPLPTPSLNGFGQQHMFPYPYAAPSSPEFMKSTPEKTASFLDVLSNYFTFGKRSDLENFLNQAKVMDARSSYEDQMREDEDTDGEGDEEQDEGYNFDFEATREALDSKTDKDFLCPKSGIWRWNGEVCIAVGPVPVWACRPNDLIVSGKIAICRNKIYFSPKVINHHIYNNHD